MLKTFFASGRAVDVVLWVIAAEFAFLTVRRRRAPLTALIDRTLAFAPGVFLLLAVRAALTEAGWPWVALALAASLPVHLADLARRRL
jgi:hypothetical protein